VRTDALPCCRGAITTSAGVSATVELRPPALECGFLGGSFRDHLGLCTEMTG